MSMLTMLTLAQDYSDALNVSDWMGRIVGVIVVLIVVLLLVKLVRKKK